MLDDDLREIELFRDLNDQEYDRLAKSFVELRIPAGHRLFEEGTRSEAFYVIKEGGVVVYRDTVGKPVQLLARLGRHDFLGEFGLFDDVQHTGSARTTKLSRVLKIRKEELLAFLDEHPAIALKLQMAAAKRHSAYAAAALELGARREVRIRVNRDVALTLEDGRPFAATLDNLSLGGLSLHGAPLGWKEGDEVSLELDLAGRTLTLKGRIAWRRDDALGVAFQETSLDHDLQIQAALRKLLDPAL
ncbi:MAG: cyclic nucleotide-binding domain-containing protein [bacterium]|nr:cyclic nucleotide-binding domain-containing protein [bacterium]